jgi:hypothetical protein
LKKKHSNPFASTYLSAKMEVPVLEEGKNRKILDRNGE